MSIIKSITRLFKSKVSTAVNNALSPEDMYNQAANEVITQISNLRDRQITARRDVRILREKAYEKMSQKASKDQEIKALIAKGSNVESHVKLAILMGRMANNLHKKSDDMEAMVIEIDRTVVTLEETRQDLAVKLELIRHTKEANEMGLSTEEDVVMLAESTKVSVDDIMMRIDTFCPEANSSIGTTTSVDVENYLKTLQA